MDFFPGNIQNFLGNESCCTTAMDMYETISIEEIMQEAGKRLQK